MSGQRVKLTMKLDKENHQAIGIVSLDFHHGNGVIRDRNIIFISAWLSSLI
jgi:acetoin utilization deacetylase AcuC-like enzyme